MTMRTANPALSPQTLSNLRHVRAAHGEFMTVQGAVQKTMILALILLATAAYVWSLAFAAVPYGEAPALTHNMASIQTFMMGGVIAGLILAFATIFKPTWAPVTAPLYAAAEGLALGGLSAVMEMRYPGIVVQAALLTVGTLFSLLFAYRAGWIQVTAKLRSGIVMATGAIFFVYLFTFIAGFFGMQFPSIHGSGPIGIGVSVVVVVVAALNLLLDFELITNLSQRRAAKHMEWYAAFSLMVTLVWLYVEFLRLLSKLNQRR